MKKTIWTLLALTLFVQTNWSQKSIEILKKEANTSIEKERATYKKIALNIWDYAELGYKETNSSNLLAQQLKENEFTVPFIIFGFRFNSSRMTAAFSTSALLSSIETIWSFLMPIFLF